MPITSWVDTAFLFQFNHGCPTCWNIDLNKDLLYLSTGHRTTPDICVSRRMTVQRRLSFDRFLV